MPTYSEIQKFVQRHHGFVPKTDWIDLGCVGLTDAPCGESRWPGSSRRTVPAREA
jgi:hypothetical protein